MIAIDINLANKKYRGIGSYVYNLSRHFQYLKYPILYITGPGTSHDFRKEINIPFFQSFVRLFFIPFILSKKNIKIFHGPSHLGIPLWKMDNVKYISTIHDLVPLFYKSLVSIKYRIIARIFLRNAILKSDKIIAVSYTVKNDIIHSFPVNSEKIAVTRLGSTLVKNKIIDVKKKYKIKHYFLAHMPDDPRKNAKNIIKAFLAFLKKVKDVDLVFTGSCKNINRKNFPSNIRFLGFIPDDEIFSLYTNALGLIFPSFYEGFGFPVLDALSTETPVITSYIGATGEMGEGASILVDPHSQDEIRDGMFEIFTNRKKITIMKQRGLRKSDKYSWERVTKKTIEVYEALL